MIVAIDGPAGSGKSTIAKLLAKELNIEYIDSGAIYRTFTLLGKRMFNDLCEGHEQEIANYIKENPTAVSISYEDHVQIMRIGEEVVTKAIRDPKVTVQVRYIADSQECRELVNDQIRTIAKNYSVVIDGRDIGTIVFPNASNKYYLDAKPLVRAKRRAKDLNIEIGSKEFDELVNNINTRDKNDMERKIAPLKQADDALYIDTSELTVEEVLEVIMEGFEQ